jgi:hypothetical protein
LNQAVKQVSLILQQELKYLSGLYPYELKKFFDPRLLHFANIFTFLKDRQKLPEPFLERLINLVAGIELLSIGTNHHNFNIGDFIKLAEKINPGDTTDNEINGVDADAWEFGGSGKHESTGNLGSESNQVGKISSEISRPKIKLKAQKTLLKSEKNYTVDLLFGDIFYSRAVIYLLKYGDHFIFESILDSLKTVHKSRLILHQRLSEVSNNVNISGRKEVDFETGLQRLLEDNMAHVLGVNSLYKTSFMIGWGLFKQTGKEDDGNMSEMKFPYELINDFILSKALNDLSGFFKALPGEYFFLKDIKYMTEKKVQIKNRIGIAISGLKQDWIAANFKSLEKLYL